MFVQLGLAAQYREEVLRLVRVQIEAHVKEAIGGVYDEPFQGQLLDWVGEAFGLFIGALYPEAAEATALLAALREQVLLCLVTSRAEEMFDVVADFPDSMVAIKELRDVANSTSSLHVVGKTFCKSLKKRLLHIGASTQQVLDMYVSVIRALRIVDPTDALLNFVTKPVRKYLRDRKDTVRSIVTSLIQSKQSGGGESSELYSELKKGGGALSLGVASDDEDGGPGGANFEEWQPAKRHPDISYSYGRGYDIVALLVSIYESTDLFVSEYRSLLSEKLLQSASYDGDAEISTLEFLKIRFGEDSLHSCEVILHDLEVSRRMNTVLGSEMQKKKATDSTSKFPIDYLVVSDNYWPTLTDRSGNPVEVDIGEGSSVKHHSVLENKIKEYCEVFEVLKKPRKLHPIAELGQTDLELCFDDGSTRQFSVSPVQASLILFVAEAPDSTISSAALANLIQMEEADVRRRMGYWVSKSVVSVHFDSIAGGDVQVYRIIEDQAENAARDDSEDSAEQPEYEEVRTNRKLSLRILVFILIFSFSGMLSNKEAMPLERVHTMLRLVTSGSNDAKFSFDMNLVQFKRFMQTLCDSDVLEIVENGSYRLRRGGF
ncbi:unnamed protein product [Ectocarpus fasciculatus]